MKRAGELLSSIFNDIDGRLLEKARGYSELFSCWASILENNRIAAAAAHSRIVELERFVVFVEADHPGWVQILQTKQRELLESLRRRFPAFEIRGIAFRYAAAPPPPQARPLAETPADPAPGDSAAPEAASPAAIEPRQTGTAPAGTPRRGLPPEDEEFTGALRRLKEGIIAREKGGRN
jgi:hypothetical protein